MMVSPISSVRFCGDVGGTSASILERPGKFSKPAAQADTANNTSAPEEKKSSGTGKKIAGTIATLAVVAAALVALPKVFPNAIKVLNETELASKPGFMKKVGHYLAKTGETIGKWTYEPIVNLFSKNKKAPAPSSNIFA